MTPGLGLGIGHLGLGLQGIGHLGAAAAGAASAGAPTGMGSVPPVSVGAVGGVGLGMHQMLGVPGGHGPAVQQYGQAGMMPGQQGGGLSQPYPYGQRRSSVADPLEPQQEQDMEHMIKFLGM
jgi:hypothetical protein